MFILCSELRIFAGCYCLLANDLSFVCVDIILGVSCVGAHEMQCKIIVLLAVY